jgi:hypothetical protein
MRRYKPMFAVTILASFLLVGCVSIKVNDVDVNTNALPPPSALLGTWAVSLQFDPNAPPSKTQMRITRVEGGELVGTFYGSNIEAGRFVSRGSTWVFAGRTADQSGIYWHSGRLKADGSIDGQTLSEGRKFLMTWSAVRE